MSSKNQTLCVSSRDMGISLVGIVVIGFFVWQTGGRFSLLAVLSGIAVGLVLSYFSIRNAENTITSRIVVFTLIVITTIFLWRELPTTLVAVFSALCAATLAQFFAYFTLQ